jgi:predicted nucleic acid-binding protein
MIAATARRHRLTLVHRDKHLSQIPASWLPQIFLDGSSR